jgi:hypothetical protein
LTIRVCSKRLFTIDMVNIFDLNQDVNLFKTNSETELPIDSELVAAGEGAFSIFIANLDSLISKSSNKPPVRSQA